MKKATQQEKTLMQQILYIASKLKSSSLKKISKLKGDLKTFQKQLGLSTIEEVIVFVGIFDYTSAESVVNLNQLADYFKISNIKMMAMYPSIKSLTSKGYVQCTDPYETMLSQLTFRIWKNIYNSIVEGTPIQPSIDEDSEFRNTTMCTMVTRMMHHREQQLINTQALLSQVTDIENEHSDLPLIAQLKEIIPNIEDRVLFYTISDVCITTMGQSTASLSGCLKMIYESHIERLRLHSDIKAGSHPLMKHNLIEFIPDNILQLSEYGQKIVLGADSKIFDKQYTCDDKYEFIKRVNYTLDGTNTPLKDSEYKRFSTQTLKYEKINPDISFVNNAVKLISDIRDRLLFYIYCSRFIGGNNTYHISSLPQTYTRSMAADIKNELKENKHPLQKLGLVEVGKHQFFEKATIELTEKAVDLFLEGDEDLYKDTTENADLIQSVNIKEKKLFFSPDIERQLSQLEGSLEDANFQCLYKRLKESNLTTGVAVLLYGSPGTGKTESVLQIAKHTGRNVMHVDISNTKSCWFGESEKIIKKVFVDYRRSCNNASIKPILLFNEADAVFSKRKDVNSGNVAQTENAIQNIILEEMEKLDGILIATTNLTNNLDKAFERRFLFKIKFDKPSIENREHIWKDKLSMLTDEEAATLAKKFDFSGGEIDNIVRKVTIDEVITGNTPSLESIITMCEEEKIITGTVKVGFR